MITKPVCRFFQGKRIKAAQRMLIARKAKQDGEPGRLVDEVLGGRRAVARFEPGGEGK